MIIYPNLIEILIWYFLGEPSKANGYELPKEITNAVVEILESGLYNTYTMSSGNVEAKEAIAKKY